uniref:Poly [ADP-ribose] polymerase n=1 Tax=Salarias fasciatus TaxID=181472 RepID=A0A672IGB1_SALFA
MVIGTFYRCTSKTTDKLTAMLGNVALQMLQGDITRAGTDVVVNTTDFTNKGVCKAILTAAGPSVEQELKPQRHVGIPSDLICSTGPGLLGCKEIIHATFRSDTQIIRKNCKKILKLCEQKGHQSVAFPAVNTALVLPPHWEPMNDEIFKKVELQKQSQEYKDIEQGFKKTANYAIQKIERVQNVYLWHAFSVCKERIIKKNGLQNLGEKLLYHGTSAESCNCIERDRFDRNYAGAHAALYGKGVYFAVNAQYSASKYSPADKAGLKRLYAARVFTGRFTAGKSSMVAPPPRGTDPTDCYDSLVDKLVQPTMFVVFHDDQAYPEYLITFK